MKLSGDLFKKYNNLLDKALKMSEVNALKETLQMMPADFVPQYPKQEAISNASESDPYDFFRERSSSSIMGDPKQFEEE
jgi:hypothetical protein